jgi:hypothetical protein
VTAKTYRQVVEELDQARRLLKTQIVHAVLGWHAAGRALESRSVRS